MIGVADSTAARPRGRARRRVGARAASAHRATRLARRAPAVARIRRRCRTDCLSATPTRAPTTSTSGPMPYDATLERMFGDVVQRTAAFGHLHLPFVRAWRGRMLVNVSSAGLPKDGDPLAHYALLTQRPGGWEVQSRQVAFDVEKVARQLRRSGIPDLREAAGDAAPPSLSEARRTRRGDPVNGASRRCASTTSSNAMVTSPPSTGSRCRSRRASSSACSGPTAPARRRPSTRSSDWRKITRGSISLFGHDVVRDWRRARRHVGLAPQEYNFDRYLNIRDVLIFQAGYYGLRGPAVAKRADLLLERFDLAPRRNWSTPSSRAG